MITVQWYHNETMQKQQRRFNQGKSNPTNIEALGQQTKRET